MKKTSILILGLLVAVGTLGAARAADKSADGEALLAKILESSRAFEGKYVGSYSERRGTARSLDPDDGDLVSTKEFLVDIWEYPGEHPIRVVRACKIDDKPVDLEQCDEEQRLEPAYRLFGKDSAKHYRFTFGGTAEHDGKQTYRIHVEALEKTPRHLQGDLFYEQETLIPVKMDMTLAKYPFGLQDLSIELAFIPKDGGPVIRSGKTNAKIYVPLLISQHTVTEFTASKQRLLTEREGPKKVAASR